MQAPHQTRPAGRDALSLALMDARNHTLQLLARYEAASRLQVPQCEELEPPAWVAGHIGWLAEWWIGRNPQRARGRACSPDAVRLASIEPLADRWFDPALAPHATRWRMALPELSCVRAYLLETLEGTLDLLDKAADEDAGLYFFRMALHHEDWRGEQLAAMAQVLGLALPLAAPPTAAPREPLLVPAGHWTLGAAPDGFVPDVEQGAHEVAVPEFEIDAQPVGWSQYAEFVDDGGYDRAALWQPEGWAWLQALAKGEGRRAPRYVDQIGMAGGTVLQTQFGQARRCAGVQPVRHVTWWEADAWARWAGRRLPTEVEWERAAATAGRRGFRWGEVQEWTAGTLRPWPGFTPEAWTRHGPLEAEPVFGRARVQRGASFATPERLRRVGRRGFALPHRDDGFVGFRTCAL